VQLLTRSFQFNGRLETVGNPLDFLNDPTRDGLALHQAHIAPLTPGGPIRGLARPQVSVRRREVVFLHYTEPEAREAIRLLARGEPLIAYTPLAVLRGTFHLPAEALLSDFLASTTGSFLPVTQAQLFFLQNLPSPFPSECELLMVGRRYIQVYHPV
jgi:hypothetical protein